jgi:hypothetical protein
MRIVLSPYPLRHDPQECAAVFRIDHPHQRAEARRRFDQISSRFSGATVIAPLSRQKDAAASLNGVSIAGMRCTRGFDFMKSGLAHR